MSAEARKATSERMRAYWAARRADKQGATAPGENGSAAGRSPRTRKRARRKR
jgi:hypothetical protein